MSYSRIAGTGSDLPERIVTNTELESRIDTSDAWIVSRTGIEARHVAAEDETTSDLARRAAERAMESAGVTADDIDLIIVATTTPDMVFPSTACILQAKLGVKQGAAFDIQAVCTGFIYALATADKLVASGAHRCALVVGAEVFSRLLDWNDRRTCVLFGDGAGAVVIQQSDEPGIYSSHLHADGSHGHILQVTGGIAEGKVRGNPYLEMDGQAVFKLAVRVLGECAKEALAHNGFDASVLDWLIPHQANMRIIKATADRVGLPMDKVVTTVARHGNTSAASVPLALDTAVRDGRIAAGQHVMLQGVGGGMTWGSILLRWSRDALGLRVLERLFTLVLVLVVRATRIGLAGVTLVRVQCSAIFQTPGGGALVNPPLRTTRYHHERYGQRHDHLPSHHPPILV